MLSLEVTVDILTFVVTPFAENCYVLKDEGEAVVIDPGECTPELLDALTGIQVKQIINTHCHIDHVGGNKGVKDKTGAPLLIPEGELALLQSVPQQGAMFGVQVPPSPDPDGYIKEGNTVTVGSQQLKIFSAPGHSPDHMILVGDGFTFSGDVLFYGSIGRTDLPGGSYEQLMQSIKTRMLTLPDETVVYSGHGPHTTIGNERATNPFLQNL